MHIYPIAWQWLEISPENLIPMVIMVEIAFMAICGFVFCRAIAPANPAVASWLFAVLLISGSAREMEMANFTGLFFWGLYYNIADGLRLLGIALFLQRRVVLAAVLFALSFTVHPIMALMGAAFAFGCLLIERGIAKPSRLALGALLFGAISIAWWLLKFGGASTSTAAVDTETWIALSRVFSFHFFPIDYGNLTTRHHTHLIPLLCLSALATFYLPRIALDQQRARAIFAGMLMLIALTFIGLLVSVYVPSPFLLKLALPRASDMLILVTLAIVVVGLTNEILKGSPLNQTLAAAILFSPFLMQPGFPALPVVLLIFLNSRRNTLLTQQSWGFKATPLVLSGTVIAIGMAFHWTGILQPQHLAAYIGGTKFWIVAAIAGLIAAIPMLLSRFGSQTINRPLTALILLLMAAGIFSFQWQERARPIQADRTLGKDYLEVQRWANAETPVTSLFMPDPTIYYGWRDFSSRSSFGNLREWLHTSWVYDSRLPQYKEGMKRFGEYSIDLKPYLNDKPSINGFYRLSNDVKKRFYAQNDVWFEHLSMQYGVDYVVLVKNAMHRTYKFTKVFENTSFVVYKLR